MKCAISSVKKTSLEPRPYSEAATRTHNRPNHNLVSSWHLRNEKGIKHRQHEHAGERTPFLLQLRPANAGTMDCLDSTSRVNTGVFVYKHSLSLCQVLHTRQTAALRLIERVTITARIVDYCLTKLSRSFYVLYKQQTKYGGQYYPPKKRKEGVERGETERSSSVETSRPAERKAGK